MKTKNVSENGDGLACDKAPAFCRADDKAKALSHSAPATPASSLPADARLPLNRCNLPAAILGCAAYQRHPQPLYLDGVAEFHADLFHHLATADVAARRAEVFQDYLTVKFRLDRPEEMGFSGSKRGRAKANYIKMVRGWSFNSDSREGAVLKGWVESRFGLTPRFHLEALRDSQGPAYFRYLEEKAHGLYGTNALEAQLDLLYTYCQYELARRHQGRTHVTLYRGINRKGEHELLEQPDGQRLMLLNNLNSFSCNRERAGEFGDYILSVDVPLTKILFFCGLLPGLLQGEDEFLVIGGVYEVALSTL